MRSICLPCLVFALHMPFIHANMSIEHRYPTDIFTDTGHYHVDIYTDIYTDALIYAFHCHGNMSMSYRYPTDILPTSNAYDVDIYTDIYTDARIVQTDLPPTTAATSKLCTDTYVDICETTIDTCAINYRYMYRCLYKYVSMLP